MPKEVIRDARGPQNFPTKTADGADAYETREFAVHVGWSRDVNLVSVGSVNLANEGMTDETYGWFCELDRASINHLIRTLRKARDQAFGADE